MAQNVNIHLTVQGTIDKCVSNSSCDMYCKFGFVSGQDWEAYAGSKAGVSYTTRVNAKHEAIFNYPVGISLRTQTPYGWPQIVLAVYGLNSFGNDKIVGYGAVHLPLKQGTHKLKVPLFSPRAESVFQKLTAYFTGLYPELIETNIVAQGPNREIMKTHSNGYVELTLNMVTNELEQYQLRV